ncbi:hypothetical protein [Rhodococcus sp. SGAir0479]|uniref:hypothetical protein n=1 Tax=Rhodococcus sp. SGAir0479 TaxID=2567884 RepID=UPI0010CCFDEE|nr:hypothetical protein [Rhodococcus sp. SGAir0479]QCQ90940.1 hypothetical protein E7742_06590 [Rhodococcus sp. SGAir0479]
MAVAVTGCAGTGADDQVTTATSPPPPSEPALLYSAALRQLILVDNPFARSPSKVEHVYVVDGAASRSAELAIAADGPQFSPDLKKEITEQSTDLPPVEFVTEPEQHTDVGRVGLTGVENDGVVIGLAAPQYQDDGTVRIGTGLWCGIDCGIALAYVLERTEEHWAVTGTTGPVTIS